MGFSPLRVIPFLTAIVLLASGCQALDPGPPRFHADVGTFPRRVGTRQVIRCEQYEKEKRSGLWTEESVLLSVQGDLLTYDRKYVRDNQVIHDSFYIIVQDDTLYVNELAPPQPAGPDRHAVAGATVFLQFPLLPESYWEDRSGPELITREALAEETVTVPTGTYRCVKLRETRGNSKGSLWYAPGVGVVKSEMTEGDTRHARVLIRCDAPN